MTMSQNEKAFPISSNHYEHGMDLRDYFAAKAMQAKINYDGPVIPPKNSDFKSRDELLAYESYKMADAMMKARGQ